jgi:hypothetical protein
MKLAMDWMVRVKFLSEEGIATMLKLALESTWILILH